MTPPTTLTGQDIAEAHGAVRSLLERILDGAGTTPNEYIVLRVLATGGRADSPTALRNFLVGERQLGLDTAAVADLLEGLEKGGLVTGSAPETPGLVTLTPAGVSVHDGLAARVAAATTRLYAGFSTADLGVAHRVLVELTDRARQVTEAP